MSELENVHAGKSQVCNLVCGSAHKARPDAGGDCAVVGLESGHPGNPGSGNQRGAADGLAGRT